VLVHARCVGELRLRTINLKLPHLRAPLRNLNSVVTTCISPF
jgi:hypothetical protein